MKFDSWKASPRVCAWPAARGSSGSRIGTICSPITAAEPYM
jgi:hypothetical protein